MGAPLSCIALVDLALALFCVGASPQGIPAADELFA
jgi:hypothetical protein